MKKTISLFLVLVMLLSLVPFAMAEGNDNGWYDGTPDVTPAQPGTQETVKEDTVTVKMPNDSEDPEIPDYENTVTSSGAKTNNGVENALAEDGVIEQLDADGNTIQTTLDVVTPATYPEPTPDAEDPAANIENLCEHEGYDDGNVSYVAVDGTNHIVLHEYVCTKCGMNYLVEGEQETHTWVTPAGGTQYCSACWYGSAEPDDDEKSYTITDKNGKTITAKYKDGVLTFDSSEQKAEIPDYVATATVTENETNPATTEKVNVPTVVPWENIADKINTVIIKKAISRIGDWSLALLENLKNVFIDRDGKVEVGDFAFAGDENLATVNVTANNGYLSYDHDTATVIDQGETYTGSTAYYGDGNVTINYNCTNTHVSDQKKISFANAVVSYGCNHTNVVTVKGYAPTATEYGLSDGQYCNACKTWITRQYKIYPNGKTVTGTFQFTRIKADTDLEKILGTTLAKKIGSADKLLSLFKTDLDKLYKQDLQSTVTESARKDMPDTAYAVYAVNETTGATPKDGVNIFNIPYPQGTYPDGYKFVVVQILEDGTTKQLTTFMTNKGIQVETTSLLPVGITWMAK